MRIENECKMTALHVCAHICLKLGMSPRSTLQCLKLARMNASCFLTYRSFLRIDLSVMISATEHDYNAVH